MIFSISHTTTYRFARPVRLGEHRFMFRPLSGAGQSLDEEAIRIFPEPSVLRWDRDGFGNHIGVAAFNHAASELSFNYTAHVRHLAPPGGPADHSASVANLQAFLGRRHPSDAPAVDQYLRTVAEGLPPGPHWLANLAKGIRRDFSYIRRTERGVQTPSETIARASGTCRDFAVLLVEMVRASGLPARFVSGYLYVQSRDRSDILGGGATHAWAQVLLPDAGWVDVDPTNGQVGNSNLIRVALVAEPSEAVPLFGTYVGAQSDSLGMSVTVKVTRRRS